VVVILPGTSRVRRRAFEHQRANLTTEPDHFLALVARQSIAATSIIEIGLPNPVADRLGRRLELLCQLFGLRLRSSSIRRRRNSSGYRGGGAAFFGIVVTSDPKGQVSTKPGQLQGRQTRVATQQRHRRGHTGRRFGYSSSSKYATRPSAAKLNVQKRGLSPLVR